MDEMLMVKEWLCDRQVKPGAYTRQQLRESLRTGLSHAVPRAKKLFHQNLLSAVVCAALLPILWFAFPYVAPPVQPEATPTPMGAISQSASDLVAMLRVVGVAIFCLATVWFSGMAFKYWRRSRGLAAYSLSLLDAEAADLSIEDLIEHAWAR